MDSYEFTPTNDEYCLIEKYFVHLRHYTSTLTPGRSNHFGGKKWIKKGASEKLRQHCTEHGISQHLNIFYWLAYYIEGEDVLLAMSNIKFKNKERRHEEFELFDFASLLQEGKTIKSIEIYLEDSEKLKIGRTSPFFKEFGALEATIVRLHEKQLELYPDHFSDENRLTYSPRRGRISSILESQRKEKAIALFNFLHDQYPVYPKNKLYWIIAKLLYLYNLPLKYRSQRVKRVLDGNFVDKDETINQVKNFINR